MAVIMKWSEDRRITGSVFGVLRRVSWWRLYEWGDFRQEDLAGVYGGGHFRRKGFQCLGLGPNYRAVETLVKID